MLDRKLQSIRLLQVMLAPGEGGAETFFEKLAMAFQAHGLTQRVIICRNASRRRRLEAAGCDVVEIPAQGVRKFLARGRVLREAKRFKPNVQLAWMSRAASALSRLDGCTNMARLGGYYKLKNYQCCDHLIGNTPGVLQYLQGAGWPRARMSLLSNFGEIPESNPDFDPQAARGALGLPAAAPVLLTLGRLHENKAQDVLIRAMPQIAEAHLLIAGQGALESSLKTLAQELGVSERVHFLGWRTDTADLFRVADLCVFPSRQEPLGNVVLEAWAMDVPIVAAASEGPSWLIESGENGLLFAVDDVAACAQAVNGLLAQPELARKLVAQGKAKWQLAFSQPVIVDQYVDFFVNRVGEHSDA